MERSFFSKKRLAIVLSVLAFLVSIVLVGNLYYRFSWSSETFLTKNIKNSCPNCNVIVVDIDLLRADALDCENNSSLTPNLCRLAKSSIYFRKNISHSDYTLPAYVSGLTSLYPASHNKWLALEGDLNPEILTLPEILSRNGYKTYYFGPLGHQHVIYNGFSESRGVRNIHFGGPLSKEIENLLQKNEPFFLYYYNNILHLPYLYHRVEKNFNPSPYKGEIPEGIPRNWQQFEEAQKEYLIYNYEEVFKAETINQNKEIFSDAKKNKEHIFKLFEQYRKSPELNAKYLNNAWLVFFNTYTQYLDLNNPDHISYVKSEYLDALKFIDSELFRIFTTVNNEKYKKRTIIIIKSDHGEEFYEHNQLSHNNRPYQELIYTPLIFKIPNVKQKEIFQMSQDIDIVPTLMEVLGKELLPQFQGKSLIPLMENPDLTINQYQIAQKKTNGTFSFRKGEWKVIGSNKLPLELYNLLSDPGEKKNLMNEYNDTAMKLYLEYQEIVSQHRKYETVKSSLDMLDPGRRERLIKEGYF